MTSRGSLIGYISIINCKESLNVNIIMCGKKLIRFISRIMIFKCRISLSFIIFINPRRVPLRVIHEKKNQNMTVKLFEKVTEKVY